MDLTLRWCGPMGAGRFPEDIDGRAAMEVSGVYLRIKSYRSGRLIGYIGQSRNLLQRFEQHLTQMLSFNAVIRDETGLPVGTPDRLALFNALDEAGPLAVAEARRTRFYFARAEDGYDIDYLTLLEALLKAEADKNLGGACENIKAIAAGAFDHDIAVIHDFSMLADEASAMVRSVVGGDPIHVPSAAEAFDHAG